ncbi:MAG: ATP-binding cassette domain-containing protein [Microbacteriaceae bacterium]|nr:ATP-binding cassette domain-containing protein [Microbacteriaceae bacterium]
MNVKKSVDPVLELKGVGKSFGNVVALRDVDIAVYPGQVTCVLGDNGAGKSTLIKILSGVHQQSEGEFTLAGQKAEFNSPRDAMAKGIATVFQDLATVPLMSVWRNFFLGNEPKKWWKPLGILDTKFAKETAKTELMNMGIDLRDTNQAIGTLSGGERQAVAIARAVYFGANVLILDEPTSALGVRQSGIVLKYILAARERGVAVIFITHNPHHAFLVGDHFYLLNRGRMTASFVREKVQLDELIQAMAGGAELDTLTHEISVIRQD